MDEVLGFLTRNSFIFEVILGYAIFYKYLKPAKHFWIRFPICLIVTVGFYVLGRFGVNYFDNTFLNMLSTAFFFSTIFALTVVSLKICFKIEWLNAIFFGVATFLLQNVFLRFHFTYLYIFNRLGIENIAFNFLCYFASFFIIYGGFFVAVRKANLPPDFKADNKRLIASTASMLVMVIIISGVTINETLGYTTVSPMMFFILTASAVIACIATIFNLFNNVQRRKLKDEMEIVTALYENEKKQYAISRQTMELLNIKYHDLKAFINSKSGAGSPFTESEKKENLELINLYESFLKTGNEALDVILAECKLKCAPLGIDIECIADGSLLSGFSDVEVYSIFGNALNNAIESIERENPEDKTITIAIKRVGDMCVIRVENYVIEKPIIADGLPVTKKADKSEHGYGTKSIRRIVNMHDGFLKFSAEEHRFVMEILYNL